MVKSKYSLPALRKLGVSYSGCSVLDLLRKRDRTFDRDWYSFFADEDEDREKF